MRSLRRKTLTIQKSRVAPDTLRKINPKGLTNSGITSLATVKLTPYIRVAEKAKTMASALEFNSCSFKKIKPRKIFPVA